MTPRPPLRLALATLAFLLWPTLAAAQIGGAAEGGDDFGQAIAVGDFDGDGYDDLAVGAPDESVGSATETGAVNVIYGGSGAGLSTASNQVWHQNTSGVLGTAAFGNRFGVSLAAGDFDGDGYDDLAIGSPGYYLTNGTGTLESAGVVNVLYGSAGVGLTAAGDQLWHQDTAGVLDAADEEEQFGYALAAGDFDNDGYDDLAVGVPQVEAVPGNQGAGAVNVLYGSSGVGLTATGDQYWHQDVPGVLGENGVNDYFGYALAAGDFDNDGYDDLAVGAPRGDGGAVNVLYGASGAGLNATGDQLWHQDSSGILGGAEAYDDFGAALTVGDFDGDTFDDLAVGVPGEDVGSVPEAGAVNVIYGGSGAGLSSAGDQLWDKSAPGLFDTPTFDEGFGQAVAVGDFDGDTYDDLAIGVPGEHLVSAPDYNGAANVLYGAAGSGLSTTGSERWHQDITGVLGTSEENDYFGWALAAGDFDNDGESDLAIGVLKDDAGSVDGAGAVNVLYGTSAQGLSVTGNQLWYQGGNGTGLAEDPLAEAAPEDAAAASSEIPVALALLPAAPNPFGGYTTLRFALPEAGRVRLAAYDALGRRVAVLVDGEREAGWHEAVLDGDALPAGVYLVRLTAGPFVQTQRVTLVR